MMSQDVGVVCYGTNSATPLLIAKSFSFRCLRSWDMIQSIRGDSRYDYDEPGDSTTPILMA